MIEHEPDSYELFRRAIVHRDEEAWAAIYRRYRSLLIAWAARSSVRAYLHAECADIADQALARAWAALTPERFAAFPSLAKLLSYLHACVETTAIDSARAQASRERLAQRLAAAPPATSDQAVLADLDREALWHTVSALAGTPAERVVLVESFAYGLPPGEICARHPQIFSTVRNVYNVKRKLFARLQRNREVLRLTEEFISI
jgi:DNA-directed RNA polymerase specialized sigma24 family protein